MRLATPTRIYADATAISKTVYKVFTKRMGKRRAYDAITDDIRDTVVEEAEKIAGELSDDQLDEIDDYLDKRQGYLKNTFKELNAPMKNKSDERISLVGDTEDNAAQWFGKTKGHEWSDNDVYKEWTGCVCSDCEDNMAAGPIPVGEEFPSGDYAPPAHPNCPGELIYTNEDGEEL